MVQKEFIVGGLEGHKLFTICFEFYLFIFFKCLDIRLGQHWFNLWNTTTDLVVTQSSLIYVEQKEIWLIPWF